MNVKSLRSFSCFRIDSFKISDWPIETYLLILLDLTELHFFPRLFEIFWEKDGFIIKILLSRKQISSWSKLYLCWICNYIEYLQISKNILTENIQTDSDACTGDGGGPLVCPLANNDTEILVQVSFNGAMPTKANTYNL